MVRRGKIVISLRVIVRVCSSIISSITIIITRFSSSASESRFARLDDNDAVLQPKSLSNSWRCGSSNLSVKSKYVPQGCRSNGVLYLK